MMVNWLMRRCRRVDMVDNPQLDRPGAASANAECGGSRGREVEKEFLAMRTTIVDPHQSFAPVGAVRHFDDGAERQSAMRRGQVLTIEDLAAGRAMADQLLCIDRGDAVLR